jgi:hypothetical protein
MSIERISVPTRKELEYIFARSFSCNMTCIRECSIVIIMQDLGSSK